MKDNDNNLPVKNQKSSVTYVEGKGLMPYDMDGLYRLSNIMCVSGMVPKEMNGKPEAVFVACQMGLEVGLSPMASVQNISVINGRTCMWGDAVLALVRSSGKLTGISETFEGIWPEDDFRAVCTAKRGSETICRSFSVDDAKRAKLWQSGSGMTPWHKYPKRMLQMRARSWALRDGFGDVLKGMSTREEVIDFEHNDQPDIIISDNGQKEIPCDINSFDDLVSERIKSDEDTLKLDNFLDETAALNSASVEQLKDRAKENFDEFWEAFEKWVEKNEE